MLLLASASQRRTELLDLMGVEHKVVPQNFDEDSIIEEDPAICSKLVVEGKNKSARELVLNTDQSDEPILTADTLVFTPSMKIVGKPIDHNHSQCDSPQPYLVHWQTQSEAAAKDHFAPDCACTVT